ncbi:probable serine/threonine-protein kinase fhkE [Drosophila rhopaloa]|uniref:Uncharacterized protein n=1 Tax=Drosophila rhopaloa TaxID=1041015 RepID=A0ABM5J3N8_DRORH|nr:probable serine/threonine-protein kinase fhkE [Drosophila rhopaloa]
MPTLSDSESQFDIHSTVAKTQNTMTNALNSSLQQFSSIYKTSSITTPPLISQDIEPKLEAIAGDDEDWWTPSNNKRLPESRSPSSANKMERNSNSPKTTESANRFAELSDMDTTEENIKSYQTTRQLRNNPDQASTSTALGHGSCSNNNNVERCISQYNNVVNNNISNTTNNNIYNHSKDNITKHPPNHKPPPIVINNCENLNGLIRFTDKIVHPSKYSIKCLSNNSVSILTADSDTV